MVVYAEKHTVVVLSPIEVALRDAFAAAIKAVGVSGFKSTSLFMTNRRAEKKIAA